MPKLSDSITRKFVEVIDASEWEVETPTGWETIISSNKTIPYHVYKIVLGDGKRLECADTHILIDEFDNEVFAKDSLHCNIKTIDGVSKVLQVIETDEIENMYDLSIDSKDHVFYTNGILSHNTQTTAAYILHYVNFNQNKTVAILANKAAASREIMSRIQDMFELLPSWMQQGVKEWNKGSFILENKSKAFTAATSSDGIRGKTCVAGDTFVTIKNFGHIYDITIEELLITYQQNYQILTPYGFKDFDGVLKRSAPERLIQLTFNDGITIKATPNHRFQQYDEWVYCEDLIVGDILSDKIIVHIEDVEPEIVYDIDTVAGVYCYISNGVVSHNCNLLYVDEVAIIPNNIAENFFTSVYPTLSSGNTSKVFLTSTPLGFNHWWKLWNDAIQGVNDFKPITAQWWENPDRTPEWAEEQRKILGELKYQQEVEMSFLGSSSTLINSTAFKSMSTLPYVFSIDGVDLTEMPIDHHNYIIVADTSKGVGGDYSAFVIIDITNFPYRVVGKYRDNKISPMLYPNVLYTVGKKFNYAHILVEINCSREVAQILFEDLDYENMICIKKTAKGQLPVEAFGKADLGVNTDKKVKRIGCTTLKSLIEESKLLIFDADIIQEFSTFIEQKGSYSADIGYHDDLVMCLVLFGWLSSSEFLKDITNTDLRKELYNQQMEYIDNQMLPVGYYHDGIESDGVVRYNF